jgi:hypothetical protein
MLQVRRTLAPERKHVSLVRVSHDASWMRDLERWCVECRCDAGLALGEAEVGTEEESPNELVRFSSSELARGARSVWRRARNSSCHAGAECGPKRCSAETLWTARMKFSETSIGLCEDGVIGSAQAKDSS